MWVVEGPRWLLRGIVYGQAALEEGVEPPVSEFLTAFRSVVVRRGDQAMGPGDLLALDLPEDLAPTNSAPDGITAGRFQCECSSLDVAWVLG